MNASYVTVREVLEENGPMTCVEIVSFFPGARKQDVASILWRMRRLVKKRVYIKDWTYESPFGGRWYPRAVFALGNRKCAPKPPRKSNKERLAKRRERKRQPLVDPSHTQLVNSVFSISQL